MSYKTIRKLLETRLNALTPPLPTSYENTNFTEPTGAYQKVQLVPIKALNPVMGDDYYREVGEFQIFLAYPRNNGTADAAERADLLKQHFSRGLTMQEGNVRVHILQTPRIAGGMIVNDRYVVPVIVRYEVEVLPQ